MKTGPGITYCCIGGISNSCGKVTCFDDLSSCRSTVDVDASDYKTQIASLTGTTPPSLGSSSSGSGESTSTTPSASSSSTLPSASSATSFVAANDAIAVAGAKALLFAMAGFVAVSAVSYAL